MISRSQFATAFLLIQAVYTSSFQAPFPRSISVHENRIYSTSHEIRHHRISRLFSSESNNSELGTNTEVQAPDGQVRRIISFILLEIVVLSHPLALQITIRNQDLIRILFKKLANLSLQDYYWRSDYFKTSEADRQVEESIARMMGEEAAYVRPMNAGDEKIGPLVSNLKGLHLFCNLKRLIF